MDYCAQRIEHERGVGSWLAETGSADKHWMGSKGELQDTNATSTYLRFCELARRIIATFVQRPSGAQSHLYAIVGRVLDTIPSPSLSLLQAQGFS